MTSKKNPKNSNSKILALTEGKDVGDAFSRFSPRERILAASLKLFVEQGYFNTNVPDISRESKCSVGSIYHNFKSKEEIARAIYMEGIREFRHALDSATRNVTGTEAMVKTVVRAFLRFSELNLHLSKYLWLCRHNEFLSGMINHPTRVGFDALGRRLTRAIRGGIKSGEIRKLNANIIWTILFGIPLSYVRDWLDGYNTTAPTQVADDISEACWLSLKA